MAPARSRKTEVSPREEKLHAVLDAVRVQFRRRTHEFHGGEHRILSYSRRTHVQTGLENEIRIELDDHDPFQQYIVEHREFPSPRLRRSSPSASTTTATTTAQASTSAAVASTSNGANLRRSNRNKPSTVKSEPAFDAPACSTRGASARKGKSRTVDDISARLSILGVEQRNNDENNSNQEQEAQQQDENQDDSDTETHVSTHSTPFP